MKSYSNEHRPSLIQALPPTLAAIALGSLALLYELKEPQGAFWDMLAAVLLWLIVTAASIAGMLTFRWIAYNTLVLLGMIRNNHFKPMIAFAQAIEHLNQRQIDLVATHDALTVKAMITMENDLLKIRWRVQTPLGEIPLGFVADFLKASQRFHPNLFPISHHDRDKVIKKYQNSEWLCRSITEAFVACGIAEKVGSNQSAKLKQGFDLLTIATAFNLEIN